MRLMNAVNAYVETKETKKPNTVYVSKPNFFDISETSFSHFYLT